MRANDNLRGRALVANTAHMRSLREVLRACDQSQTFRDTCSSSEYFWNDYQACNVLNSDVVDLGGFVQDTGLGQGTFQVFLLSLVFVLFADDANVMVTI